MQSVREMMTLDRDSHGSIFRDGNVLRKPDTKIGLRIGQRTGQQIAMQTAPKIDRRIRAQGTISYMKLQYQRSVMWAVLLLAAGVFVACSDPVRTPGSAAASGSVVMTATVASGTDAAPAIRVTDKRGRGMGDVLVHWQVTTGGGSVVNDTVRSSKSGDASSGGWILGTTAGAQKLEARIDGLPVVVFTATAVPGPVAALERSSAAAQSGEVNSLVTAVPTVKARDAWGNAIAGVAVSFAVTSGSGVVGIAQATTNAFGLASAGFWRLGTKAGQQTISASAAGTAPVAFAVSAFAAAPVAMQKLAEDSQYAAANSVTPRRPGVRVVDSWDNPVGNVSVLFTPGPSSGTVTGGSTVSDPANGAAYVGSWTVGDAPVQTLVASSPALAGKSVSFTAQVVPSLFNLDVRFVGDGGSTVVRNAFIQAAARWRSIILGHVHNVPVTLGPGSCTDWTPAINEVISDVIIFARITDIDGPGNILGQAGPCFANTATRLPLFGIMEFDEADMEMLVANGTLTDVVLHEMGHVLGIGTLWNYQRNLLVGMGGSDPYFVGANGRDAFSFINNLTYSGNAVPVENSGGPGTRDSHWRESVLLQELMTGWISRGENPLSRVTVGSLADMGYTVNINAADPFTISAMLRYAFPFVAGELTALGNDIADIPLYEISPGSGPVLLRRSQVSRQAHPERDGHISRQRN